MSRPQKAFMMMKIAAMKRPRGECACNKGGMRKPPMMDPSDLAEDLMMVFPGCAAQFTDALEEHITELEDIKDCMNHTCIEKMEAVLGRNFSKGMRKAEHVENMRQEIADKMDELAEDTDTDVVEKMRKHKTMGPFLKCMEKSPECARAARDMKCGMAVKQGRKAKGGDVMKEIRLGKELSSCGSGKLSFGAKMGLNV